MANQVQKNYNNGGVGAVGLLGVAFVILKLTGFIGWSWWWVTAPFWASAVIFIGIILLIMLTAGFVKLCS